MAVNVTLLDHQARLLQAPFLYPDKRFFMLCAGYGSGKTRGLVFFVLYLVKQLLGKKDTGGTNPKILVGSKNITFLAKTWTNDFEAFLQSTNSAYSFDRAKNIITIGNVQIILIALEEPNTIYGYSVNFALLDEVDELPAPVCMEAIKSVNDRVRQHIEGFRDPAMVITSTSQGLKGFYQTYLHFKDNGIGFVLMRARTQDNHFNGEDYIRSMYAMYKGKEKECYLEGAFVSVDSGLVFPDYDPKVNDLDEDLYDVIEDFDTVYIGQDFNSFGYAAVAAVVLKGAVVVIKDYDIPDIRKAPQVFRYDFPTQKIVWIPDATYKEHYSEFKKELRQYDITIAYRKANPLVQDRVFAVNRLLTCARFFVCPLAQRVRHSFMTHQRDPKTGAPMKGGKGTPDHISDCVGYVTHYVLCWHRAMKDLYRFTLGSLYGKRRAQGAASAELEVPTMLMSPQRLRDAIKEADNVADASLNASPALP